METASTGSAEMTSFDYENDATTSSGVITYQYEPTYGGGASVPLVNTVPYVLRPRASCVFRLLLRSTNFTLPPIKLEVQPHQRQKSLTKLYYS